jgi:hypothetical protein
MEGLRWRCPGDEGWFPVKLCCTGAKILRHPRALARDFEANPQSIARTHTTQGTSNCATVLKLEQSRRIENRMWREQQWRILHIWSF